MVPKEARDLVLAGAIVSIILNPLAFILMERLRHGQPVLSLPSDSTQDEPASTLRPTSFSGHDVLIGYGRVGSLIGKARAANPALDILARAHSDAAVDHLKKRGASLVVLGEAEIADRMLERAQGKDRAASNGPTI